MGSPAFAVPALEALIRAGHEVVCVYSQPPRPAGRGQKETLTAIHSLALQHHLDVRTPISLKSPEEQQAFADLKADIAVVAAYGLLLPEAILKGCRFGCINIHPSLLPRWRGAAPIHRPLLAGDKETGVAIMQMDKGLDTGDILSIKKQPIDHNTSYLVLHDILANLGAKLLIDTLISIENGTATRTPQSSENVAYANKLTKEEGKIDWGNSAEFIQRQIRALTPWPGSFFMYHNEIFKISEASYEISPHNLLAGSVIDDKLTIACGEGFLKPSIIQRSGKKPCSLEEFLRGFPIPAGTKLD